MQNKNFKHILALCMTSLLFSQIQCSAAEKAQLAVQNKKTEKDNSIGLSNIMAGAALSAFGLTCVVNKMASKSNNISLNLFNNDRFNDKESVLQNENNEKNEKNDLQKIDLNGDNNERLNNNGIDNDKNSVVLQNENNEENDLRLDLNDDDYIHCENNEKLNSKINNDDDNETKLSERTNSVYSGFSLLSNDRENPERLIYDLSGISKDLDVDEDMVPTVSEEDKKYMKDILERQFKGYSDNGGQEGAEGVKFNSVKLNGLWFGLGHKLFRGNYNVDKTFGRGYEDDFEEGQNKDLHNGCIDKYVNLVCTFAGLVGMNLNKENYKEMGEHLAKGLLPDGGGKTVDVLVDNDGQIVMVCEDNFKRVCYLDKYGNFDKSVQGCPYFTDSEYRCTHFVYKYNGSIRHGFSAFIDPDVLSKYETKDGYNLFVYRFKFKLVNDGNKPHYQFSSLVDSQDDVCFDEEDEEIKEEV